ncbi:hypothetical protein CL653_03860 [bacterium]|nr:hypothetical protein [bacterium]
MIFSYLNVFILQYLVPFIFAIGLIFFFYAIVYYFIIGPGEEPMREDGRVYFIKANVWFFVGLAIYLIVAGLNSFVAWIAELPIDADSEQGVLKVPDTPQVRR